MKTNLVSDVIKSSSQKRHTNYSVQKVVTRFGGKHTKVILMGLVEASLIGFF